MKVYGGRISLFVRKVLAVLEWKGLAYDHVGIAPHDQSPEFKAISPLGKIPAFADGEVKLADSTVICEYLEEQYPAIATLPASPADRARARWLEEFADTTLTEACGPGLFYERFVKPKFFKQPTDEAKVTNTITNVLPPLLDYLESQVPAQGFVFGNCGRVDISIAGPLLNAEYADYSVDAAKWPKLAAYIARVKAEPVIAKLRELEGLR